MSNIIELEAKPLLEKVRAAERPNPQLKALLYVLLRDHLPAGVLQELIAKHIVQASRHDPIYSNSHLAEYAEQLILDLQQAKL